MFDFKIDICSGEDCDIYSTDAPESVLRDAETIVAKYTEDTTPTGIAEEDFILYVKSNGYVCRTNSNEFNDQDAENLPTYLATNKEY